MVRSLMLAVVLVGCAGKNQVESPIIEVAGDRTRIEVPVAEPVHDAPDDVASSAPASPRSAPAAAVPTAPVDRPASVDGIEPLLLARHVEDLPSRQTLDQHDEPAQALQWLAQNAERAATQDRALRLIGLYPTTDNASFLASYAQSASTSSQRAAAIRGLADMPVAFREPHRSLLESSAQEQNRLVAKAASGALEGLSDD